MSSKGETFGIDSLPPGKMYPSQTVHVTDSVLTRNTLNTNTPLKLVNVLLLQMGKAEAVAGKSALGCNDDNGRTIMTMRSS